MEAIILHSRDDNKFNKMGCIDIDILTKLNQIEYDPCTYRQTKSSEDKKI